MTAYEATVAQRRPFGFMSAQGRFRRSQRGTILLLLLIGVFSMTQVRIIGKIGISEFFMVLASPFVFFQNIQVFKRDKSMRFFVLIILWTMGALLADKVNGIDFAMSARGLAAPIVLFGASVCLYVLLRKNIYNFRWLLVGIAISSVVSTFVFQRGVAGDLAADGNMAAAVENVVGYKLFWTGMANVWLSLPIAGWYLSVPLLYSLGALFFVSIFCLLTGGRSSFLVALVSAFLIFFGKKKIRSMQFLKKHFIVLIFMLGCVGLFAKGVYKFAVTHGYLGEAEMQKYETQTRKANSVVGMLVGGRMEAFVGLYAAIHRPILGYGSWAVDNYGHCLDFASKYGDERDVARIEFEMKKGGMIIPGHSHIVVYWLWHGIFALWFWLYIGCLVAGTLFRRMSTVPWFFGYFAVTIPAWIWDYFFSPMGLRVNEAALFAMCLLIRKIASDKRSFGYSQLESVQ